MVMPGQFLERPTLIPVAGVVLEGVAHRGAALPPLLILPPRPEEGGSMDHVLGAELAWAAVQAGHATLRFNHRGVGASQGARGELEAQVEDARAALDLARENAAGAPVALVAVGGAAAVALRVAQEEAGRVAGLCLISPSGITPEEARTVTWPLLLILPADEATPGRLPLATALVEAGGRLELVEGADAKWRRQLPQAGRLVGAWLQRLSGEASGGR